MRSEHVHEGEQSVQRDKEVANVFPTFPIFSVNIQLQFRALINKGVLSLQRNRGAFRRQEDRLSR